MFKWAFAALVLVHGLIHFWGFGAGMDPRKATAFHRPITPGQGWMWFFAAVLLITAAVMYLAGSHRWWLVALTGVVVSQALLVMWWQDARFGTIANLIIVVVAVLPMFRATHEVPAGT